MNSLYFKRFFGLASAVAIMAMGCSTAETPDEGTAEDEIKKTSLPGVTVVSDADEAWHDMGKTGPLAYEWLYFDVHTKAGDQLAVTFAGPNCFDVDLASLSSPDGIKSHNGLLLQGGFADGKKVAIMDFTRDGDVSFQEKPWKLSMGKNNLTMTKNAKGFRVYDLDLDARDAKGNSAVRGHLRVEATMVGWKLNDGNVFYEPARGEIPAQFHKWFVTAPKAKVSGSLTFTNEDGTTSDLILAEGSSGYHDHNYGTLPLGAGNDGWYWWRAEVGDQVVNGAHLFGKSSDAVTDKFYTRGPSDIYFVGGTDGVKVFTDKVEFEAGALVSFDGLTSGMKGPKTYTIDAKGIGGKIYRSVVEPAEVMTQLPYYFRQASTLELTVGSGKPHKAAAVTEQIDFPLFTKMLLDAAAAKAPKP